MFFYNNLTILSWHLQYLSEKTGLSNLFCVGGCVRDVLLGFSDENDLTDIDITCAGDPNEIWKEILEKSKIDLKDDFSLFHTQKYGTITLTSKSSNIKYELTPFRTETTYTDKRHPDEVCWTCSLLDDAKIRDFTVNCLYYTICEIHNEQKEHFLQKKDSKYLDIPGFTYFPEINVCILSNHAIIEECWPQGCFTYSAFFSYLAAYCNAHNFDIPSGIIGIIVDPFNGIEDLENGVLCAVGDPDQRFAEDALRIIRAIRFISVWNWKLLQRRNEKKNKTDLIQSKGDTKEANTQKSYLPFPFIFTRSSSLGGDISESDFDFNNKYYFDFEKQTWMSLKKNFFLVRSLPKERINGELMKVLTQGSLFTFLSLCDELNLIKDLFPALYATKGVRQPVRYHPFDTYVHIQLCVYYTDYFLSDYPLAKMAVLYHDVGKPDQFYLYSLCFNKEQTNKVYLNHRETSGMLARVDLEKLGFSKKQIHEIVWYIDHHHKPEEILNAKKENQLKKLRSLYAEAGEQRLRILFDICRVDRCGQYNPIQPLDQSISEIDFLEKLLDELVQKEGQFTMKELVVNGTWLIEKFNLKPGPLLGELLKKIFYRVMDDIKERNKVEEITNFVKGLLASK